MFFDSKKKKNSEGYLISSWVLVLRYFSMQIFKATLNRGTDTACGTWCVTAAFTGGVPEILSCETPSTKWNLLNQVLLRTWVPEPFSFVRTSSAHSEPPHVLLPILRTAQLCLQCQPVHSQPLMLWSTEKRETGNLLWKLHASRCVCCW